MRTLTCVVQYRARLCVCVWVCVWVSACTRTHSQNAHLSPQKCIPKISEHGCVTPHLGGRWLGALCYIFAFAGPYFLFMIEQWAWKTRSKKERETGSFHTHTRTHTLSLSISPSLPPPSHFSCDQFNSGAQKRRQAGVGRFRFVFFRGCVKRKFGTWVKCSFPEFARDVVPM